MACACQNALATSEPNYLGFIALVAGGIATIALIDILTAKKKRR